MILPHDLEAERGVLGALMLGPSPADLAEAFVALKPEAFYRGAHAAVFAACQALYQAQMEIDEITVSTRLREDGTLEQAGGHAAVAQLTEDTPTAANLREYARTVRDRWMRRRLMNAALIAHKTAADLDTPIPELIDQIGESISEIATSQVRGEMHAMSQLVREQFKNLQKRADSRDEPTGVATGFYVLDAKLGGLQGGEYLILAGRPSMGKTAMATAIAENAAIRSQIPTLVVSLEMNRDALTLRALSSHARVDGQKLRYKAADITSDEWSRLTSATAKLDTKKLHIVDSPNLTVLEIRAFARLMQARHGLGLLVVDYLGLIRPARRDHREREVAEISGGLKALAKELNIPVLCLAQLNRGVESREDKRPRLSDLRESGSLEQDADAVIFVHRPGYYDPSAPSDIAEIIIAKQRNGPVGIMEVGWAAQNSKFYNLNDRLL